MADDRTTILLDDPTDRWRYRCPAGHANWEPTNNHFWCQQCARSWREDVEPEFRDLRDVRDGGRLRRDDVRLVEEGQLA